MSKRKSEEPGWVYLFCCVGTSRWKIGYSKNVWQRWAAIECQSPYPLAVIAAKRGIVRDEQDLHHEFRKYRTHREWFDLPEPAVYELLAHFGISEVDVFTIAHLS